MLNIGANCRRRSPSPSSAPAHDEAIVDVSEVPSDYIPHSAQVVPRYLASQMAGAGAAKQQVKGARVARSISPSIDFRAQAASSSSALLEQGVGTRVLLGDVKMGNFVDIIEIDVQPAGDVKVPSKSFSQVQVRMPPLAAVFFREFQSCF
jgi:hypothetical protein